VIKCLIVEDEILAQQVIQSHMQKNDQLQLVGVCNNVVEAREVLNRTEVDLIFLDIELPGMSGLNFLRSFPESPLVILTTAYAEYALESYEFNVIDYLLKPISLERFTRAINKINNGRLLTLAAKEKDISYNHIFIKSGSKFFKVDFSEIIYVEGMRDYLKIHTRDHNLVTHQTMNDMEKLLPAKEFIRVHKSFIVAIDQIKVIYGNTIELQQRTLPIGSNYKDKVMNLLGR
jgi:two-component system, LytTR family, response regulator